MFFLKRCGLTGSGVLSITVKDRKRGILLSVLLSAAGSTDSGVPALYFFTVTSSCSRSGEASLLLLARALLLNLASTSLTSGSVSVSSLSLAALSHPGKGSEGLEWGRDRRMRSNLTPVVVRSPAPFMLLAISCALLFATFFTGFFTLLGGPVASGSLSLL